MRDGFKQHPSYMEGLLHMWCMSKTTCTVGECVHMHMQGMHAVVGSFQRAHLQEAEDTSYYLCPTKLAFFSTLYFCFAGRRLLFFPACTDRRRYQQ